jgi:4-amino-4-deoxy-L-arabinose transferase-like glycosyltransferase
MKFALLVFPLVIGAALLMQVRSRGIDPDELEHLHAACAVSWGKVPYRDFFEHHAPGLYYVLQPILRVTGTELPALWWSRLLMWVAGMATLALTGAMAYRVAGGRAALVAPTLLSCTTIFFWKSVEVRPDVPAALLLTLAACILIRHWRRAPSLAALLVGLLLGLATLLTQKAIVPAAAMILAQIVAQVIWRLQSPMGKREPLLSASGDASYSVWHYAALILAGAATWLAAIGLFWTAGGAEAFLHATVSQLWRWPVRQSPLVALRPTLLADLPLWIGAAAAIVASIRGVCTTAGPTDASQGSLQGRAVLSLTVLICFVGGLVMKAAYSQYYLLWFPMAAVVAADWLVRRGTVPKFLSTRAGLSPSGCAMTPRTYWMFSGALGVLVVLEAFLAANAGDRGADGALPHLLDRFSTTAIDVFAVGFIPAVAIAAAVCLARRYRAGVVLWLAVLGFGYAGLRNVDALCWSNREQVAALEQVGRLVGPDETVLDGFTGLGAFRRHAYYYWWLNPYSLAFMQAESGEQDLLARLKQSPPKLICVDENVRSLRDVMAWIEENYRPVEPPLYVRR